MQKPHCFKRFNLLNFYFLVLQNLLRPASVNQQKFQQKSDDSIMVDATKLMLKKSTGEIVTSNHNSSQHQHQQYGIIHHQNQLPQQIAIIGSPQGHGQGQNRIFLASSSPQPSTSTSDGTIMQQTTKLHINTAGQQQQITTLTSIPNTAILVDGKTTVGDGSKIQQRVKLYDAEKNRFLYTTNIKGSRGAPFLTQLNAPKVVNIVPIHSKNNIIATASTQGGQVGQVVTPTILRKSDLIQRGTINNAQNIRPTNNGGGAGGGGGNGTKTVTTATVVSDSAAKQLLQANDNNQVSGINTTTR